MALTTTELKAIRDHAVQLRGRTEEEPSDKRPKSVEYLEELLGDLSDEADYIALATLLESEYSFHGMLEENERLYLEQIARQPSEPMPSISFATFLLFEANRPEDAALVIEDAIAKATAAKRFLRHAYNTAARVFKRLERYPELETILTQLTELSSVHSSPDVAYEEDFLVGLPEGSVSAKVVSNYKASGSM